MLTIETRRHRHGFGPIQAGSAADSLPIDCAVTIAKAKATGGAQ